MTEQFETRREQRLMGRIEDLRESIKRGLEITELVEDVSWIDSNLSMRYKVNRNYRPKRGQEKHYQRCMRFRAKLDAMMLSNYEGEGVQIEYPAPFFERRGLYVEVKLRTYPGFKIDLELMHKLLGDINKTVWNYVEESKPR